MKWREMPPLITKQCVSHHGSLCFGKKNGMYQSWSNSKSQNATTSPKSSRTLCQDRQFAQMRGMRQKRRVGTKDGGLQSQTNDGA